MNEEIFRIRRQSHRELVMRHRDASKDLEGVLTERVEESCEISRSEVPKNGRTAEPPPQADGPRGPERVPPTRPSEHSGR